MDINAVHAITRAMHAGELDEAQRLRSELLAAHPSTPHMNIDIAIVNDFLDIVAPTHDVAPDAHLDDIDLEPPSGFVDRALSWD